MDTSADLVDLTEEHDAPSEAGGDTRTATDTIRTSENRTFLFSNPVELLPFICHHGVGVPPQICTSDLKVISAAAYDAFVVNGPGSDLHLLEDSVRCNLCCKESSKKSAENLELKEARDAIRAHLKDKVSPESGYYVSKMWLRAFHRLYERTYCKKKDSLVDMVSSYIDETVNGAIRCIHGCLVPGFLRRVEVVSGRAWAAIVSLYPTGLALPIATAEACINCTNNQQSGKKIVAQMNELRRAEVEDPCMNALSKKPKLLDKCVTVKDVVNQLCGHEIMSGKESKHRR